MLELGLSPGQIHVSDACFLGAGQPMSGGNVLDFQVVIYLVMTRS